MSLEIVPATFRQAGIEPSLWDTTGELFGGPLMSRPWDHAVTAHPDWPRCQAEARDRRGHWYKVCGYPLDPANGDERYHPGCDQYRSDRTGFLRRRELAAVRADNNRRVRLAALEQRIVE